MPTNRKCWITKPFFISFCRTASRTVQMTEKRITDCNRRKQKKKKKKKVKRTKGKRKATKRKFALTCGTRKRKKGNKDKIDWKKKKGEKGQIETTNDSLSEMMMKTTKAAD